MAGPEERPDRGEVLDLGVVGRDVDDEPGAPVPASSGSPRVSRRAVLGGAGALAVVGGIAVLNLGRGAASATPSPSPSPSGSQPTPAVPTAPAPAPSEPAVAVGAIGEPPFGGGDGWDLFAYTDGAVLKIHPATGEIVRTRIPSGGDGPFSVVPARGRLLLHRDDYRPGWVVPDGEPPTEMPVRLVGPGPMLPGPDLDHVWVQETRQGADGLALRGVDGASTRTWLPLPPFLQQPPLPDGAGGVLFLGVGGVYRGATPRPRLVTTGALVAVGPPGLLSVDCDDSARCGSVLHGRTGTRRPVPLTLDPMQQGTLSSISPDGRTLAWITSAQPNVFGLTLVDLASGARRPVDQPVAAFGGAVTAWSPDGRWLAVLGDDAGLHQVDVSSGRSSLVSRDMPAFQQLAVRVGSQRA